MYEKYLHKKLTPCFLKFIIILFLFIKVSSYAQKTIFNGNVVDIEKKPLYFANILAKNLDSLDDILFTSTDENGKFELKLTKNKPYFISISYLGFKNDSIKLIANQDITKTIRLSLQDKELGIVTISANVPIIIKEDTTIYNVKNFITGNEIKLKDVLETLPGIEVDRAGNVFFKGARVRKINVEDKPFFGGNSRLAVNNIPADVVNKIEILENHNDVAFLKQYSDNNELVLNVKLKDDRKQFYFGDLLAGTDFSKKYILHPYFFYYSPKTNLNIICDVNNIGEAALTFQDVLEMDGRKNLFSSSSLSNNVFDNFDFFLKESDFLKKENKLIAINSSSTINKKLTVSFYSIFTKEIINSFSNNSTKYLLDDKLSINQNIRLNMDSENGFSLTKVSLDYNPNTNVNIKFNASLKLNTIDNKNYRDIVSDTSFNFQNEYTSQKSSTILQNLEWNKKYSTKSVGQLTVLSRIENKNQDANWDSKSSLFRSVFLDEKLYNIIQILGYNKSKSVIDYDFGYLINRINNLKIKISTEYLLNKFDTNTKGGNETLLINNIPFFNIVDQNLFTSSLKIQNTTGTSENNIKYGINLLYYSNNLNQIGDKSNKQGFIVFPNLSIKRNLINIGKVDFSYYMNNDLPDIKKLSMRNYILNFNTLSIGNKNLLISENHNFNLSFSRNNLLKNTNLFATIGFTNYAKDIRNNIFFENQEQIQQVVLLMNPEQKWNARIRFSKQIKKLIINPIFEFSNSDINYTLNNNEQNYSNARYLCGLNFKLKPNKNIKIDLALEMIFNNYATLNFSQLTNTKNASLYFELFLLKNIRFNFDTKFNFFYGRLNKAIIYNSTNFKISYSKKNSRFSFEARATNLLDNFSKIDINNSAFILQEDIMYIQPRIITTNIVYKF
jgi:hypothetical protein